MVVGVPLAALLALLAVAWPAARRRLGILTPLITLVILIAIPLTTSAGEALEEHVPETSAVHRHTELGDQLIYWVGPLFALTVLWWAVNSSMARQHVPQNWYPSDKVVRVLTIAVGVATIVVALGAMVMVYLIGESGARAVWG